MAIESGEMGRVDRGRSGGLWVDGFGHRRGVLRVRALTCRGRT